MNKAATILVVDDEPGVRQSFYRVLNPDYEVIPAETAAQALDVLAGRSVDLVLLDILLPDENGIDTLKKIRAKDPDVDVVVVTAVNDVQTAVNAIKMGAYEYVIKPFDVEDVLAIVRRTMEKRRLHRQVRYLRSELSRYSAFERMVGEDPKMAEVFHCIDSYASDDGTVLIQGESGTGKELVSRAIHSRGPRSGQPFVVISCAAIPANLMEAELFGHARGAYTGAFTDRAGKLEIAHGGTVFLDDIDCLDLHLQAKLLRALQEKTFERLGSTKTLKADIRFIAASNRDLGALAAMGEFRADLYYRLNVLPVMLPPLRERKRDIPLLLDCFLERNAQKNGGARKSFSARATAALVAYHWPGNVRELQNLVERHCIVSKNRVIRAADVSHCAPSRSKGGDIPLKTAVSAFEKRFIADVMLNVNGSRKRAAEKLGIHRNTLAIKLKDLDTASK